MDDCNIWEWSIALWRILCYPNVTFVSKKMVHVSCRGSFVNMNTWYVSKHLTSCRRRCRCRYIPSIILLYRIQCTSYSYCQSHNIRNILLLVAIMNTWYDQKSTHLVSTFSHTLPLPLPLTLLIMWYNRLLFNINCILWCTPWSYITCTVYLLQPSRR